MHRSKEVILMETRITKFLYKYAFFYCGELGVRTRIWFLFTNRYNSSHGQRFSACFHCLITFILDIGYTKDKHNGNHKRQCSCWKEGQWKTTNIIKERANSWAYRRLKMLWSIKFNYKFHRIYCSLKHYWYLCTTNHVSKSEEHLGPRHYRSNLIRI